MPYIFVQLEDDMAVYEELEATRLEDETTTDELDTTTYTNDELEVTNELDPSTLEDSSCTADDDVRTEELTKEDAAPALEELSTTSDDESTCVAVVDFPAQENRATVAASARNA